MTIIGKISMPTYKIGILDNGKQETNYIFNKVSTVVNNNNMNATFKTGKGYIEIPSATQKVLDELKALNIKYEEIK